MLGWAGVLGGPSMVRGSKWGREAENGVCRDGTSNRTVGDAALLAVNTEEGVAGLGMCVAHRWFFQRQT